MSIETNIGIIVNTINRMKYVHAEHPQLFQALSSIGNKIDACLNVMNNRFPTAYAAISLQQNMINQNVILAQDMTLENYDGVICDMIQHFCVIFSSHSSLGSALSQIRFMASGPGFMNPPKPYQPLSTEEIFGGAPIPRHLPDNHYVGGDGVAAVKTKLKQLTERMAQEGIPSQETFHQFVRLYNALSQYQSKIQDAEQIMVKQVEGLVNLTGDSSETPQPKTEDTNLKTNDCGNDSL